MDLCATWYCCRQRAGPLVKECRALRPRFGAEDPPDVLAGKRQAKKYEKTAVTRSSIDRLELRLALLGWHGTHYTLTFDDEHLPKNFDGVRRALRAFLERVKRWRKKLGKDPAMDYIYVIEGLHGNHRWHIHFICDYYEGLSPAEIHKLWRGGDVDDDEPVLLDGRAFRRLAVYFHKERRDGYFIPLGKHPWSCSRSLSAKLTPPEKWKDESGVIEPPANAIWPSTPTGRAEHFDNGWGQYYKLSWVEPDGSRACARAQARARHTLK